jgi:hypothetical protein
MMSAVASARRDREFDKFLYASVGDDNNGMPLTVLSALARMDVVPWEEASKLMLLPQETAVTQLVALLGSLGNSPPYPCASHFQGLRQNGCENTSHGRLYRLDNPHLCNCYGVEPMAFGGSLGMHLMDTRLP